MSETSSNGRKRLVRRKEGRLVGGVCVGIGDHFGIDANLVRLAFGVFVVFYGVGVLAYALAWAIIPEEGEKESIAESFVNKHKL